MNDDYQCCTKVGIVNISIQYMQNRRPFSSHNQHVRAYKSYLDSNIILCRILYSPPPSGNIIQQKIRLIVQHLSTEISALILHIVHTVHNKCWLLNRNFTLYLRPGFLCSFLDMWGHFRLMRLRFWVRILHLLQWKAPEDRKGLLRLNSSVQIFLVFGSPKPRLLTTQPFLWFCPIF